MSHTEVDLITLIMYHLVIPAASTSNPTRQSRSRSDIRTYRHMDDLQRSRSLSPRRNSELWLPQPGDQSPAGSFVNRVITRKSGKRTIIVEMSIFVKDRDKRDLAKVQSHRL